MKSDVKRILSLSLFLAVLGLVCAGLLACINHITAPIIEENRMKELEKQLEIINIKEPTIVDCELVKGVDAVYTGVYNKGLSDETECYVIQVTVKNDYTQITSVVAISRSSGKIVALAPFSGDPSFTTHGKNGAFENNDFGLVGSGSSSINSAFENVAGATKSSESIKTAAKLAFEQYELLNSNVESERTYANDGTYLAYKLGINNNSPEVTFVTVTIRNDVLVHINIDTVQGTNVASVNGEGETVYTVSFDKETKREKGYGYHMHWYTYAEIVGYANASEEGYIAWLKENNKLEWFEQMDVLQEYVLQNGIDSVSINENSKFDNVSGVTVSDHGYIELIKEAEENAKRGLLLSITPYEDDLIIAKANVNSNGVMSNVVLDVIEGKVASNGTFSWSEKSKNELGYAYHMHWYTYAGIVGYANATEEGYIAWLKENNKLEWFEQAALIAKAYENGQDIVVNSSGKFDNVASVSINDAAYVQTLKQLEVFKDNIGLYMADGKYVAYKLSVNKNAPELIFVTITIKNDKIVDVEIDTIQGTNVSSKDSKGEDVFTAAFNSQSKRELGYAYHMHWNLYKAAVGEDNTSEEGYIAWLKENNKLEWFEQMDILEDKILNGDINNISINQNNKFENIAGVSVSDYGYIELVREAAQYAIDGVVKSITTNEDDLIIATANIDKNGQLSDVVLDTITGNVSAEGTFSWNDKSKNELGYLYHMHWYTYAGIVGFANATEEGYIEWLKENNKLEWFEQAALIVKAWEKDHSLVANNGKFDTISGVSISDALYIETLNKLLEGKE